MKKVAFAALLVLLAAGCGKREEDLVIKNSCKGVWLLVVDGDKRVLAAHLNPGQLAHADIKGYRGTTVYLLASGYDLQTNEDRGTAQTSREIPWETYSSPTGPDQIKPWDINSLTSSRNNGGCSK